MTQAWFASSRAQRPIFYNLMPRWQHVTTPMSRHGRGWQIDFGLVAFGPCRTRVVAKVSRVEAKEKDIRDINNVAVSRTDILNSTCRLCGQRGHWKAECPQKDASSSKSFVSSTGDSMPISFTSAQTSTIGMPLEFVQLPQYTEATIDEPRMQEEFSFCSCNDEYTPRKL